MPKGLQSVEQQTISREFIFPGNMEALVAARESMMAESSRKVVLTKAKRSTFLELFRKH